MMPGEGRLAGRSTLAHDVSHNEVWSLVQIWQQKSSGQRHAFEGVIEDKKAKR